jgi:hypothetical protein
MSSPGTASGPDLSPTSAVFAYQRRKSINLQAGFYSDITAVNENEETSVLSLERIRKGLIKLSLERRVSASETEYLRNVDLCHTSSAIAAKSLSTNVGGRRKSVSSGTNSTPVAANLHASAMPASCSSHTTTSAEVVACFLDNNSTKPSAVQQRLGTSTSTSIGARQRSRVRSLFASGQPSLK